jgi:hypothetical protein
MDALTQKSNFLKLGLSQAATAADEAVRKGEFDAALSGVALRTHTHVWGDVTDFASGVRSAAGSYLVNGDAIVWVDSGLTRKPALVLLPNSGLVTGTGVGVDFGTGANQAARGNHTHTDLHPAVTLIPNNTIDTSLATQAIGLEVRLWPGAGLKAGPSGVGADVGTGSSQVAAGNHTHGQLHAAASSVNSTSLRLSVDANQVISGGVILDPSPSSNRGRLGVSANGLYVELGPSGTQAAAGNHVHANATQYQAGFLSPADKLNLDNYQALVQVEQNVSYARHDLCPGGEYVGGMRGWGTAMQIVWFAAVAQAPGAACLLGLDVDGTVVEYLTIPSGTPQTEVSNFKFPTALFMAQNAIMRVRMVSGTGNLDTEASRLDVVVSVKPALGSAPSYRIDAGGSGLAPYAADAYYSGGASQSTSNAIDLSAVTSPAPQEVMRTQRFKYNDSNPLTYTFTGLARVFIYQVRIHFAEWYFNNAGDQRMNITCIGGALHDFGTWDTLDETSGVKYKAAIFEGNVQADVNGQIIVRLTPLTGLASQYNLSVNAIEILPLI